MAYTGTYKIILDLIRANAPKGLTFDEIVTALNKDFPCSRKTAYSVIGKLMRTKSITSYKNPTNVSYFV